MHYEKRSRGFTLAELLIVVAIVAVLVAIAIPAFMTALDRAKAATWEANARSIHAEAMAEYLGAGAPSAGKQFIGTYDEVTYTWLFTPADPNDTASRANVVVDAANGGFDPAIAELSGYENGWHFDILSGGTLTDAP